MPGPAPKPAAQRRRTNAPLANTVKLPAAGRPGPPPAWPLRVEYEAEAAIWVELWATPQAAAWERLGYHRVVARYCRLLMMTEGREDGEGGFKIIGGVALLSEARQLEDRLGLTPMAMLRLRWEIVADELAERREDQAPKRRRLKAVDPDASTKG